MHMTKDLEGR